MGFRFGKRIKICKGVNLNLSSSGVGLSVGPKGFKVSTGPRGTRATISIPGTGISYSETLSSAKRKYAFQETLFSDVLGKKKIIRANSTWELDLLKKEQLNKWQNEINKLNSKLLTQSLKNEAEIKTVERKEEINQFLNILKFTLEIDDRLNWDEQKRKYSFLNFSFFESEPLLRDYFKKYKVPSKNFLEKIFIFLKKKRISLEKLAENEYELDKKKYFERKQEAFKKYSLEKEKYEKELKEYNDYIDIWKLNFEKGEVDAVKRYIEVILSNSKYPDTFDREYEVDYFQVEKSALISLKLPSFTELSSVSEFKFSPTKKEIIEKNMGKREYNEFYKKVILNTCLRTIHEIFEGVYPKGILEKIFINIWVNYVDFSTGEDTMVCILSGEFERKNFEEIKLENVEVEACCDLFKVKYYKNFSLFKEIEPILEL